MRRKVHPSRPSGRICCFFSSLKTLLIPSEATTPLVGVNVPCDDLVGRFWVTPDRGAVGTVEKHAVRFSTVPTARRGFGVLEEDRLKWHGVKMDEDMRPAIVIAFKRAQQGAIRLQWAEKLAA